MLAGSTLLQTEVWNPNFAEQTAGNGPAAAVGLTQPQLNSRFILDGRAQGIAGTGELIAGAIIVSVLAIGVDLLLAVVQRWLARRADPQLARAGGLRELADVPLPQGLP